MVRRRRNVVTGSACGGGHREWRIMRARGGIAPHRRRPPLFGGYDGQHGKTPAPAAPAQTFGGPFQGPCAPSRASNAHAPYTTPPRIFTAPTAPL